jgi:hypothetical protein
MQRYGLMKLCPGTVCRWLKLLGFTYEAQCKSYYVDGYEKCETVTYRKVFVKKYLSEEVQMFRWLQIEQEEAKNKLEKEKVIPKDAGFRYNHPLMGHSMVEYHVDTCEFFNEK